MTTNLFTSVELAPRDPILGLNEAFNADPRSHKVNLGVGVYTNNDGKIPLLKAVREAEKLVFDANSARGYLLIEGIASYNQAVQKLLFGEQASALTEGRVVTAQSLGGTGGLRIGADFLKSLLPNATVAISDPSWENHRALFEKVGFPVVNYPYYDASTHGVKLDAMLAFFKTLPPQSIVLLHACCHNPTGVDLNTAQWQQVIASIREHHLVAFLDIAYQGFGDGIESDAQAVRLFAESGLPFVIASSFSKSFSLYGERVGAISIVTENKDESNRVLSQVKKIIRTLYSNPPTHGGSVVSKVLNTPELRALWSQELGEMRERIKSMRTSLVEKLTQQNAGVDFSFISDQRGMFSYSGLSTAQVERLRTEFGIYAVGTGRICVAALNTNNIDYVADAISKVL